MNIALRDTYRPAGCRGGVGYVIILLAQALNKRVSNLDIYTAEPDAFEGCAVILDKSFALSGLHRKIRTINKIIRPDTIAADYDAVIFPHPFEPLVYTPNAKRILILYDLIPLIVPRRDFAGAAQYLYYHLYLRRVLQQFDKIVVISENTKKDLLKEYNVPDSQIYVIPCGYNSKLKSIGSSYENQYNKVGNYIIFIGSSLPHKNSIRLIQAMSIIGKKHDISLLLVGISATKEYLDFTKKYDVQKRVHFLGGISDEILSVILRDARALVFPSLYEGFGMPPLEAMSLGVPTVVSNCSSMPEVCGDASVYFDPLSVTDIAAAIETVLTDLDVRNKCVARGYLQVEKYSWDIIAEKYIELIASLK
jgi:glycosyltransferase involved in cell wall biosynthesis